MYSNMYSDMYISWCVDRVTVFQFFGLLSRQNAAHTPLPDISLFAVYVNCTEFNQTFNWFGPIVHFSVVEYHVVKSHFEFQFAEWYFNHYAQYCSNMARHSYLHKHYLFITIYFNQRFWYFTQVLLNKLPVPI